MSFEGIKSDLEPIFDFNDIYTLNNEYYLNQSSIKVDKFDCLTIPVNYRTGGCYTYTSLGLNMIKADKKNYTFQIFFKYVVGTNNIKKILFAKNLDTIKEFKNLYIKISKLNWITTQWAVQNTGNINNEAVNVFKNTVINHIDLYGSFETKTYSNEDYQDNDDLKVKLVEKFINMCEKNEKLEIGIKYLLFSKTIQNTLNFPTDLLNICGQYLH